MTATALPSTGARPTVEASYSTLGLHRRCPQAFVYREAGYERLASIPAPERDFGSWWSAWRAAEALERGRALGSLLPIDDDGAEFSPIDGHAPFDKRTVTRADVEDAARAWWERRGPDEREAWQERLGEGLPDRLAGAAARWLDAFADEREHERPLAVEHRWKRETPTPRDAPDGPVVVLKGAVDEIYLDTKRDMVVIRDHKTSKTLAPTTALDDLMDSQLATYAWGVAPWLAEHGVPAPRGLAYDRMRSVKPTSPKLTATGALSKAVSDYDLVTYLEWAATDTRPTDDEIAAQLTGPDGVLDSFEYRRLIEARDSLEPGQFWGTLGEYVKTGKRAGEPKFGTYALDEALAEDLRSHSARLKWFARTLRPASPYLLRAHLRAAVDGGADIQRTRERAERTGGEVTRALTKFACGWCDYADLCRAQMMGGVEGDYDLEQYGLTRRSSAR